MKRIVSILLIIILITLQVSVVFADETYYVQVGAFQSKYNAEKYTNYMISIGYEAVTIKVYDLYKVFLGPYDTEERAREILADYKSVGGDGFFVIASQMYYRTEINETETEEVSEEVEETEEAEVVEETEESTEEEDTEEEVVEETTETEETTDQVEEKEEENNDDTSTIEVKVIEQEEPENDDYKLFTIILIVVLWVLFIIGLVIFRLNQNKVSTK